MRVGVAMKVHRRKEIKLPHRRSGAIFENPRATDSGRLRQVTELLQCPDPARRVTFDCQRRVVDGGIPVRNLAREQHEHYFEHFMADGDNGLLGSPTNNQTLKTALELSGGWVWCSPCLAT